MKRLIVLRNKDTKKPIKIGTDWYKIGKWADDNCKPPFNTREFVTVKGLIQILYLRLFYSKLFM